MSTCIVVLDYLGIDLAHAIAKCDISQNLKACGCQSSCCDTSGLVLGITTFYVQFEQWDAVLAVFGAC